MAIMTMGLSITYTMYQIAPSEGLWKARDV